MSRLQLHLTMALVALLTACGPAGPEETPPSPTPSVVIFVIDTLRADQLGAYGNPSGSTPHIDALARQGVLFENVHSPAPWTLPSVASLLTSTFPCEHEVLVDGDLLPSSIPTLAERFQQVGYATASLYANPYAGTLSGLDRGFDHAKQGMDSNGRAVGRVLPSAPFFLYIHNTGPHDPYQETKLGPATDLDNEGRRSINRKLQQLRRLTRSDFTAGRPVGSTDNSEKQKTVMRELKREEQTIRTLYAKDVARADYRLGDVVNELKSRGVFDDTIFLLLSDHGEEFDEHGSWQHDQSVYEELLRVPLIIRLPGARFAGKRITAPASLVDIAPTLADLLAQPALAAHVRGRSLLPAIEGSSTDGTIRVTGMRKNRKKHFRPAHELRGDLNVVARDGNWKSIWNVEPDRVELYDLEADPSEQTDLAPRERARAAAMREASEQWLQACRPADENSAEQPAGDGSVDPESLERLRALGYAD